MNTEVVTDMPLAIDGIGSRVLVILGQGIALPGTNPDIFYNALTKVLSQAFEINPKYFPVKLAGRRE